MLDPAWQRDIVIVDIIGGARGDARGARGVKPERPHQRLELGAALGAGGEHDAVELARQRIEVEAIAAVAKRRADAGPVGQIDRPRDAKPIARERDLVGLGAAQILDPRRREQFGRGEPRARLPGIARIAREPRREPEPIERGRGHGRHHRDQQQHGEQGGAFLARIDHDHDAGGGGGAGGGRRSGSSPRGGSAAITTSGGPAVGVTVISTAAGSNSRSLERNCSDQPPSTRR